MRGHYSYVEVGGEGSLFPMGRWVVRGHYSYGEVGGEGSLFPMGRWVVRGHYFLWGGGW